MGKIKRITLFLASLTIQSCGQMPADPRSLLEGVLLYDLFRGAQSSSASATTGCRTRAFCYIYKTTVAQADAQSIGGIANADSICSADAARPAGAISPIKALLVGSTIRRASLTANVGDGQIDWVLWPSTQYRRADGTTVIGTTQPTGLFNFPLNTSFSTGGAAFHAGLTATWLTSGNDCTAWTNNVGTKDLGDENDVSSLAIFTGNIACANPGYFLMCVEQ